MGVRIPDTCEVLECSAEALCKTEQGGVALVMGIDRCVLPELQRLWAQGIRTVCSCCGHGDASRAYIRVDGRDAEKMLALGYEPFEPHECVMHENTASFRAKYAAEERERPVLPADVETVRAMWRRIARVQEEAAKDV